jgi:hypothetical protein
MDSSSVGAPPRRACCCLLTAARLANVTSPLNDLAPLPLAQYPFKTKSVGGIDMCREKDGCPFRHVDPETKRRDCLWQVNDILVRPFEHFPITRFAGFSFLSFLGVGTHTILLSQVCPRILQARKALQKQAHAEGRVQALPHRILPARICL